MANLPIEEIERRVGSRYALTVLAGLRARELRDGSPRLVNADSSNPILIALQEIHEGKIYAENLILAGDLAAAQAEAAAGEIAEAEAAIDEVLEAEAAEAAEAVEAAVEEPAVEAEAEPEAAEEAASDEPSAEE